jgi:CDP-paratose 2-epimerase
MATVLVTGSSGLIGSESVRHFSQQGFQVLGIDNDMRRRFFGVEASTLPTLQKLKNEVPNFEAFDRDIRDIAQMRCIFSAHGKDIKLIIHTAAQPSHDWAATDPHTDFTVNANGTLNLLELTRQYCPEAVFIFTSTSKVYGDTPNRLPFVELKTRWEVHADHPFYREGIDESMSIDQNQHSLFGVSKASADLMVQEYGRYFGIKTGVFRAGCLTGPHHSAVEAHGFLSYVMKCAVTGREYRIYGYNGKQVRDNLHSFDLVQAFAAFFANPRVAEVYNIGGSRGNACSILEAITLCESITGRKMHTHYVERHRTGDHIWWISSVRKFQSHYPHWQLSKNVDNILQEIYHNNLSI